MFADKPLYHSNIYNTDNKYIDYLLNQRIRLKNNLPDLSQRVRQHDKKRTRNKLPEIPSINESKSMSDYNTGHDQYLNSSLVDKNNIIYSLRESNNMPI